MLLNINFFKPSGKWYTGGTVEVSSQLYEMDELIQDIVNNQDLLVDGWQGDFDVVIEAVDENDFATHLFKSDRFIGIAKENLGGEDDDK